MAHEIEAGIESQPRGSRAGTSGCAPVPARATALVLAGGGALGAYEAGVLRYVLETLARERGAPSRFDIYAGTSVGALNVSFLAANAEDPPAAARWLWAFWEGLTLERILRFGPREMSGILRLLLGLEPRKRWRPPARLRTWPWSRARHLPSGQRPPASPHQPVEGLFDTAHFHEEMEQQIDWPKLRRHLASGRVKGIALCATEVCTGTSTIFYETDPDTRFLTGRDPLKEARRVRIDARHAMASAAIPFLFPSVQIDGVCYVDGALRQNTPLNPALRLGADRVLVVSLTQDPARAKPLARAGCRRNPYPGALFLLGKTAQIFMTQTLDYEIARVELYNRLIAGGCAAYGPDFLATLNQILGATRNASYRPVRTCHVRPSEHLGQIAREALRQAPSELRLPGATGRAAARVLRSEMVAGSELLPYLLFTPTFIHRLLEQGYQDARDQREALVHLLETEPAADAAR